MELAVQRREKLGRSVKALRAEGFIPAELYGKGLGNLHLSVSKKDFKKVLKEAGENTVVNLTVDGRKYPVLIHDISYDVLTDDFQNIDFYQVKMDEKLKVGVPLEFVGVAPAVKEKNGLLVKSLQEIKVEALPADLPHKISVDISRLNEIGQSLYVKNLAIPQEVKVLVSPDTVVATVTAKVTEAEELAMQQAAVAGVEGVKVETEEKKAEREAAKAPGEAIDSTGKTTETQSPVVKEAPRK